MMKYEEIDKIVHALAGHPQIVQASGGNISVKKDNRSMIIKASGLRFDEMKNGNGLVEVDYSDIKKFYMNHYSGLSREEQEREASRLIQSSVLQETDLRPSMETGFHSVLDRIVIHTHPVYLNIISCMKDASMHLNAMMKDDFSLINYASPGHQLSKAIAQEVMKNPASIMVLKNHGLLVSGTDTAKCVMETQVISNDAEKYLKNQISLKVYPRQKLEKKGIYFFSDNEIVKIVVSKMGKFSFINTKFLFPDAVVFLSKAVINDSYSESDMHDHEIQIVRNEGIYYNMSKKNAINTDEVLTAYLYLLVHIMQFGEPDFLSQDEVDYLRGMDSEKYRKKLMSK